jgi:hypothetical protein
MTSLQQKQDRLLEIEKHINRINKHERMGAISTEEKQMQILPLIDEREQIKREIGGAS